jgi:hypothetical protein
MQSRAVSLVSTVSVLVVATIVLFASSRAAAQPSPGAARPHVAAHEVESLEQALSSLAAVNEPSVGGSIAGILVDGMVIAAGALLVLDGSDAEDDNTQLARGVGGALLMGLGASSMAMGLRRFDYDTTDTRRLARFRTIAARGPIPPLAFARFEGELIMQADLARVSRLSNGVGGLGLAVGGAGALTLGLAADNAGSRARVFMGVLGGAYLLTGLWAGILSLTSETEVESIVRAYIERRLRKLRAAQSARRPILAPSGLGLSLQVAF